MRGLQAVIARGAARGKTNVNDRGPALEFVMMVAMEQVGYADGSSGASGFDCGECRVIVDDLIGEENFLAAAVAHVERGKIIERARNGHACEKQIVGFVPKAMVVLGVAIGQRSARRR